MSMSSHTFGDVDRAATRVADSVRQRATELRKELSILTRQGDDNDLAHRARMAALDEKLEAVNEEAEQHARLLRPPAAEPEPEPAALVEPEPEPVVEPEPEPVVEPITGVTRPTIQFEPSKWDSIDPRAWSWVQWAIAIIGAIIGVAVASRLGQPLSEWLLAREEGVMVALFSVIFFILIVATGFFGGGWLGHWLQDRRKPVAAD